jgi:hypothetical protein
MLRITKATSGLGQIPISINVMLIHGLGDGAFVHNSKVLLGGDSNSTTYSLCLILQALERLFVK